MSPLGAAVANACSSDVVYLEGCDDGHTTNTGAEVEAHGGQSDRGGQGVDDGRDPSPVSPGIRDSGPYRDDYSASDDEPMLGTDPECYDAVVSYYCQPWVITMVGDEDEDDGEDGGPGRTVTISDVEDFGASSGSDVMEPNGWAILGLDANFYSSAKAHVVEGELLGEDARVRFTPVSWQWDYGDGSTRVSTTGGASWADLDLEEFEPTATSHVYDQRGEYEATLTVSFAAEYSFAGGEYIPIAGTVDLAAPTVTVWVGGASTVLVGADCNERPDGPGC